MTRRPIDIDDRVRFGGSIGTVRAVGYRGVHGQPTTRVLAVAFHVYVKGPVPHQVWTWTHHIDECELELLED